MLYSLIMQTPHQEWSRWATVLQHYHLDGLTAWVLEAGGPFALLGAQALYFFRSFLGPERADSWARVLEDKSELRGFLTYLQSRQIHG